jgi:RHS repeat-associated protein
VYFGPVEIRNWQVPGQEQVLTYPLPSVRLTNGVPSYLRRDHLGSIRAITDATGAKIESAVYKPFGEQTETLSPANLTPESKGWIGKRYDADAGLQYLNARYYDPVLGLFLQPDWFEVLRPGVGTNRFSYSFNDPVNKLDPTGNTAEAIALEAELDAMRASGTAQYQVLNLIADQARRQADGSRQNEIFAQIAAESQQMAIDQAMAILGSSNPQSTGPQPRPGFVVPTRLTAPTKILGNPQVTRGADGLIHAATSVKLVIEQVLTLGPRNVSAIHFNRPLSAIFGIGDRRRPDVTIVTRDGCVVLCEVASRTQTLASQLSKLNSMAGSVRTSTGATVSVVARSLNTSLQKGPSGLLSSLHSLVKRK